MWTVAQDNKSCFFVLSITQERARVKRKGERARVIARVGARTSQKDDQAKVSTRTRDIAGVTQVACEKGTDAAGAMQAGSRKHELNQAARGNEPKLRGLQSLAVRMRMHTPITCSSFLFPLSGTRYQPQAEEVAGAARFRMRDAGGSC